MTAVAGLLASWLTRFAAAPAESSLTRASACAKVDGRPILLVPSARRFGLRAADGSRDGSQWRLDAALARHFAALSLSLADRHPASRHQYLDGDADQEITARFSLNEYPPDFMTDGR